MAELVDALRFISGVFGICIDLIRTGSNAVLITNLKSNYLKTEWFETFGLIMVYGAQQNGVCGINAERGHGIKVRFLSNQQIQVGSYVYIKLKIIMKRVIAILAVVLVMVSCGGKVSEESVGVVDSTAVVVDSVLTETPTIDTTEVQPVREEPIGIK